jgi:enoyl-CoA hydratase/carnithine racemase
MTQVYRTLRVAPSDEGVLGVVIDAPPMNLIGPELVRDLVTLIGELESDQETRIVVLESADPEYFVPHVDLTKVAEYTDAEQAERYGWINRALPDADLDAFVARLARRIASFPADAVRSAKRVLNELTLPGADAIRADARRFRQLVASDTAKGCTAALFTQGPADPWPARTRPRRPHRSPLTEKQIQRTAFGTTTAAGADDQGLGQGRSRARRTDRIWRIAT